MNNFEGPFPPSLPNPFDESNKRPEDLPALELERRKLLELFLKTLLSAELPQPLIKRLGTFFDDLDHSLWGQTASTVTKIFRGQRPPSVEEMQRVYSLLFAGTPYEAGIAHLGIIPKQDFYHEFNDFAHVFYRSVSQMISLAERPLPTITSAEVNRIWNRLISTHPGSMSTSLFSEINTFVYDPENWTAAPFREEFMALVARIQNLTSWPDINPLEFFTLLTQLHQQVEGMKMRKHGPEFRILMDKLESFLKAFAAECLTLHQNNDERLGSKEKVIRTQAEAFKVAYEKIDS